MVWFLIACLTIYITVDQHIKYMNRTEVIIRKTQIKESVIKQAILLNIDSYKRNTKGHRYISTLFNEKYGEVVYFDDKVSYGWFGHDLNHPPYYTETYEEMHNNNLSLLKERLKCVKEN